MYGDFSRVLDARSGRYSAVLAQQGRLLLDAELNEQTAITLEYLRRLTVDLLGPFAGPLAHAGFAVELVIEDKACRAVKLSRGHYYVYGLRCEAPRHGRPADEATPVNPHTDPFVVYLLVWEQTVSAIQAPDLADPALGQSAPDTTRRSQVRWHPQLTRRLPGSPADLTALPPAEIVEAFDRHNSELGRRAPLLRARITDAGPEPEDEDEDERGRGRESGREREPARIPGEVAFRGAENQLYRVEVHRGGGVEEATFKWSRDNASVELALDSLGSPGEDGDRTATLRTAWRDARSGLEVGDWVELVDDHWVPFGTPTPLMRVAGVKLFKRELTLEDGPTERRLHEHDHPFLRRWDQDPETPAGADGVPVAEAHNRWFELEDGVQVRFEGHRVDYRRGDYWLIPARTSGLLWPRAEDHEPAALTPHGPARYLAPLALATSLVSDPIDLRSRFARVPESPPAQDAGDPEPTEEGAAPTAQAPALARRRWRLRGRSGFDPDVFFDLPNGDTTVGRDHLSELRIERSEVSRHHAILTVDGERLTVKDAGSGNGTYVNGKRRDDTTELVAGDTLSFGTDAVQVEVERVSDPS